MHGGTSKIGSTSGTNCLVGNKPVHSAWAGFCLWLSARILLERNRQAGKVSPSPGPPMTLGNMRELQRGANVSRKSAA